MWISVEAPVQVDLERDLDGGDPPLVEGSEGLTFVDLGVLCPESEGAWVPSVSGSPGYQCQRRALGTGPGLLIELALPPDVDLEQVIAELRMGSLDDLRTALGPLDGLDQVTSTPPTMPATTLAPPPDTPFCNAWVDVLAISRTLSSAGELWSEELGVAQEAAAAVAPTPELARDIRLLDDLISTGESSDTSAAVMQRVVNATWAECPGIQEWVNRE
jgi:hypothetical protein